MNADELAADLASVDSYLCLSSRIEHRDLADRLRAHIDALTAERDRKALQIEANGTQIGALQAHVQRLTEQVKSMRANHAGILAQRDTARAEVAALREQVVKLNDRLRAATADRWLQG